MSSKIKIDAHIENPRYAINLLPYILIMNAYPTFYEPYRRVTIEIGWLCFVLDIEYGKA